MHKGESDACSISTQNHPAENRADRDRDRVGYRLNATLLTADESDSPLRRGDSVTRTFSVSP
jgi:hypothetical protein